MLPVDLVRARRRANQLKLSPLRGPERQEAVALAEQMLELAKASLGSSAEELTEVFLSLDRASKHEKLFLGLKKLVMDACQFSSPLALDAVMLRKKVFERASAARSQASVELPFRRQDVLEQLAGELGVSAADIEQGLFGDLKGAQQLVNAPVLSAQELVERYELCQLQGVLLRAVQLTAQVECKNPAAYRRLFSKLKFRQLLYRLRPLATGGYEIDIDGPFSLFESVTKYGMQLALIVPALLECGQGSLRAELRWGKERKPLEFETSWGTEPDRPDCVPADSHGGLRSEVQALLASLEKTSGPFAVSVAHEILEIPGEGLCVPDLRFDAPDRPPVFLEVLGYWSRDAVWKRVEWSQAGRHERVVFAVSSKLRVKQEVLPQGQLAALYVYKTALNRAAVLAHVEALAAL